MAYEMGTTLLVLEAAAAVIIANVIITVLTSPINNIPGPILAKFTNLWRFFNVWRGKAEVTQLKLHRRYGPAVRLGPNCVSLSDPDLIKTIYSTKEKWVKVSLSLQCRFVSQSHLFSFPQALERTLSVPARRSRPRALLVLSRLSKTNKCLI